MPPIGPFLIVVIPAVAMAIFFTWLITSTYYDSTILDSANDHYRRGKKAGEDGMCADLIRVITKYKSS